MMFFGIPNFFPHSFEEEVGSGLHCDSLLAGGNNFHLGKSINHHKNTIISLLGVHALFLNGWFGNGVGP
jgi:hypothetical protein